LLVPEDAREQGAIGRHTGDLELAESLAQQIASP